MLGLFASLKDSVPRGDKLREPHTEGFCNKLHYRASVVLLLGCSLLVTCLEWVGNGKKIACVLEGSDDSWTIPKDVINTYCYVLSTFILPKHYHSMLGEDNVALGVGSYNPQTDDVTYKAYYQWVPFVLFLQACMFYTPHLLYKKWEGGKVKNIIAGLNRLILDKKERTGKEKMLAEYVMESKNTHNYWAMKMLVVDFLNLVNVVGNIYFVDTFLGGEFTTYGFRVLSFLEADPEKRIDPMAVVFPRVTKCTFRKYGPSGTIQRHDSICVLPINIVNEKIYVFLWFWLLILTAITVVSIAYHIILMITPSLTKSHIKSRSLHRQDEKIESMTKHFEMGDWKLMHILAKNMEPVVFAEFVKELYKSFSRRHDHRRGEADPWKIPGDHSGPLVCNV